MNKVGTVLATEYRLLLARECRGRSEAAIVASIFRLKLLFLDGKDNRRMLAADVDADFGLTTCVSSRIGQMA